MRDMLLFVLIFASISINVYAGQSYNDCVKQEQTLRTKEAGQCSGLQYLFNPSACFATKKLLREYDEGKCRKTDPVENGLSKEQPQKSVPVASQSRVVKDTPKAVTLPAVTLNSTATAGDPVSQTGTTGSLLEENARIKAENERLKAELEKLQRTINK